jgi:hypothetical protein
MFLPEAALTKPMVVWGIRENKCPAGNEGEVRFTASTLVLRDGACLRAAEDIFGVDRGICHHS